MNALDGMVVCGAYLGEFRPGSPYGITPHTANKTRGERLHIVGRSRGMGK